MIVLLDTDVLIDLALDRQPFAEYASIVLDSAEIRHFDAFIAWHSISNFYYLLSPSDPKFDTLFFINDLLGFISVSPTETRDVQFALSLPLSDFEDALQVAAARACKAEFIITRNIRHYKNSPIPAVEPRIFCKEL